MTYPVTLADSSHTVSFGGNRMDMSSEDYGLHLFLNNPCVLDLPAEGTITFRFKKGPMTVTEGTDKRPAKASADLCLYEIVSSEEGEAQKDDDTDESQDAIDDLFDKAQESSEEVESEDKEKY